MKKQAKKLTLNRETLRPLENSELQPAIGGGGTNDYPSRNDTCLCVPK